MINSTFGPLWAGGLLNLMMADPELFSVPSSKSKTDMLRRVVAEHRRIPLVEQWVMTHFPSVLLLGGSKKLLLLRFLGIVVLLPRWRTHIHADSANKLLVDLIEIMWELPRSGNQRACFQSQREPLMLPMPIEESFTGTDVLILAPTSLHSVHGIPNELQETSRNTRK